MVNEVYENPGGDPGEGASIQQYNRILPRPRKYRVSAQ